MATYFSQEMAAAFQAAEGRFGIFFRMAGDGPEPALCLWSGLRNSTHVMSGVLAQQFFVDEFGRYIVDEYDRYIVTGVTGASVTDTYRGLGTLIEAPDLDHLVDGTATDVTFTISLVSSAAQGYFLASPPEVRGRRVNLGIVAFNDRWKPATPIIPIAQVTASSLSFDGSAPDGPTGPHVMTLGLICENGDTSRSRGAPVYWTPQQWGSDHPESTFVERVYLYQRGVRPAWPRF